MIRYVGCDYARPRLDAFADGELPMGDQVLVETHLRWCQTCAARLEDTQTIGASLRLTARAHAHHESPDGGNDHGVPEDLGRALAAMQSEVLAQSVTEYEQSFAVRVQELFSDMRLWWPAMGATVAVALSVGVASNIWKAASVQQPASLAAVIESLADQPQRLDSAMYLPRLREDGAAFDDAMLVSHDESHQDELMAFAAVVTRDGTIGSYALLEQGDEDVEGVMNAMRQFRFAPAQRPGGQVVAVTTVMLLARTTVRASHTTLDLGVPLTRPALAVPPPVAKPVSLPPEGASSQDHSGEQASAPIESAAA